MLQHSFWALWTCIFTPNNLLYHYLALKLIHECDLDGLENGASENHVMIIPGVNNQITTHLKMDKGPLNFYHTFFEASNTLT